MNESNHSNRRLLDVAVVGATGAVGETLLDCFAERDFPIGRLVPLASQRSAGSTVRFRGAAVPVEEARPEAFDGVDLVFFAATGALSRTLAPEAVARGAVVIDKSDTWRMNPEVPLVVPEINPAALDAHRGIIACPNCTTIGVVMALAPIQRAAGLARVIITTLQAVSGKGRPGLDELECQNRAWDEGTDPLVSEFARPIAHNVVPVCGDWVDAAEPDGRYTLEELKLRDESRKILSQPDLNVSMTCVRVPVEVGHSAAILVETVAPLNAERARRILAEFPGLRVSDAAAPTPRDVAGTDEVWIGRIRDDLSGRGFWLWQVADNLRKGAATNAVQIAESLLERGRLGTCQRVGAKIEETRTAALV